MAKVTVSTLFSTPREAIVSLLRSNVTDPKTGRINTNRRFIYREEPDTTSRSFSGYPFIVVDSPDINSDVLTLSGLLYDDSFVFTISVYTEFVDTKARNDSISDAVLGAILSSSGQTTMETYDLFNPVVINTSKSQTILDDKEVSIRVLTVAYSKEVCS